VIALRRLARPRRISSVAQGCDRATRDQMVGKGWLAEGDGPDLVVMCAPQYARNSALWCSSDRGRQPERPAGRRADHAFWRASGATAHPASTLLA